MDCRVRAGLECQAALIQAEIDLLGVSIDEHEGEGTTAFFRPRPFPFVGVLFDLPFGGIVTF